LQGSFTKSAGRRKLELEKEIKEMKYNTDEDINIFKFVLSRTVLNIFLEITF